MRECYARMPVAAIAERLGRSPGAVRFRGMKLDLQSQRIWTPDADAAVRRDYGQVRTVDLACRIGRTPAAIRKRAFALGIVAVRAYSAEELDRVRAMYPTHATAEIAERLRRPVGAIYRMAHQLGLSKCPRYPQEFVEAIRRLHADGLNDREIADRLGSTRDTVHAVRYARLKLPAHGATIESRRRCVAKQLETLGLTSPTQLRTRAFRLFAERSGWPNDLRPRAVQILNVLAARGPMTAFELASAIGMPVGPFPSGKRRILLASNDPEGTYTAHLMARGLVLYVRGKSLGAGSGRGRGRRPGHYILTAEALEMAAQRAAAKGSESCHEDIPH